MPLSPADLELLIAVKEEMTKRIEAIYVALRKGANVNCRGADGLTPLHIAAGNNDVRSVQLLLKPELKQEDGSSKALPGAKTYLVNRNFETPLQYAMQQQLVRIACDAKKPNVISELLRHRTPLDMEFLNDRLGFCLANYQDGADYTNKNRALLDYVVSHLVGLNIHGLKHREKNAALVKYESQIRSYKGEKKDAGSIRSPIQLEGFDQEKFLPLRVRTLFEILFEIELELIPSHNLPLLEGAYKPEDRFNLIRELLKKELLNELETLHICQATSIIHFGTLPTYKLLESKEFKETRVKLLKSSHPTLYHQLAENIYQRLQTLSVGQELTFAGGWVEHAVYITFIREEDTIILRLDNLGPGCDRQYAVSGKPFKRFHMEDKQRQPKGGVQRDQTKASPYLYPAVLGPAPLSTFDPNNKKFNYIVDLIKAFNQPEEEAALKAIYNVPLPFLASIEKVYPSSKKQSAGNCTVKNHQIGLKIRLLHKHLYEWVRQQERSHIHSKEHPLADNYHHPYWALENKPRPAAASIQALFFMHYKRLTFKGLLERAEMSLEGNYVPLELIRRTLPKDLSKETESSSKPEIKETKVEVGVAPNRARNTLIVESIPQSVTLDSLFQRQATEKENTPLKRVAICGVAGSGKSTLCLRMAQQWASGRLWRKEFNALVLIRLGGLTTKRYPLRSGKPEYSLVEVIQREYANVYPIRHVVVENLIASPEKTLWLLDGGDEVIQTVPTQLKAAIEKLLGMPNLLITMRPEAVSSFSVDARVDLIGFSNGNVKAYIENFYQNKPVDPVRNGENLIRFLQDNPELFSLACTPILLEILCNIWRDPAVEIEQITTMTQLYQQMCLWLMRNYVTNKCNERGLLRSELDIYCKHELEFLEAIAFQGTKSKIDVLPSALLQETMKKIFGAPSLQNPTIWRDAFKKILALGLLKDVGETPSQVLLEHNYEFIHRSFKEYHAARLIASAYALEESDESHQAMLDFTAQEKYNPYYRNTWYFVAGILATEFSQYVERFFNQLAREPREITPINELGLWLRCLEETQFSKNLQYTEILIKHVIEWNKGWISLENKFHDVFFQWFYRGPRITLLHSSIIVTPLIDSLSQTNEINVIKRICSYLIGRHLPLQLIKKIIPITIKKIDDDKIIEECLVSMLCDLMPYMDADDHNRLYNFSLEKIKCSAAADFAVELLSDQILYLNSGQREGLFGFIKNALNCKDLNCKILSKVNALLKALNPYLTIDQREFLCNWIMTKGIDHREKHIQYFAWEQLKKINIAQKQNFMHARIIKGLKNNNFYVLHSAIMQLEGDFSSFSSAQKKELQAWAMEKIKNKNIHIIHATLEIVKILLEAGLFSEEQRTIIRESLIENLDNDYFKPQESSQSPMFPKKICGELEVDEETTTERLLEFIQNQMSYFTVEQHQRLQKLLLKLCKTLNFEYSVIWAINAQIPHINDELRECLRKWVIDTASAESISFLEGIRKILMPYLSDEQRGLTQKWAMQWIDEIDKTNKVDSGLYYFLVSLVEMHLPYLTPEQRNVVHKWVCKKIQETYLEKWPPIMFKSFDSFIDTEQQNLLKDWVIREIPRNGFSWRNVLAGLANLPSLPSSVWVDILRQLESVYPDNIILYNFLDHFSLTQLISIYLASPNIKILPSMVYRLILENSSIYIYSGKLYLQTAAGKQSWDAQTSVLYTLQDQLKEFFENKINIKFPSLTIKPSLGKTNISVNDPAPSSSHSNNRLSLKSSSSLSNSGPPLSSPSKQIEEEQIEAESLKTVIADTKEIQAFQEKLTGLMQHPDGGFTFQLERSIFNCLQLQFLGINKTLMDPADVRKELTALVKLLIPAIGSLNIKPEQYKLEVNWEEWRLTITADHTVLGKIGGILHKAGAAYFQSVSQAKTLFFKPMSPASLVATGAKAEAKAKAEESLPTVTCILQ